MFHFSSFSQSLTTLVALAFCGTTRAVELIDPAALGFGAPAVTLDFTFQNSLDYESESGGLDLLEVRAIAPLAGTKRGNLFLGAGLNYAGISADFGGFGGQFSQERKDLHTISLQLFAAYDSKASPWWALGFLTPGLSTDFTDIGSDAFTANALGLIGYHWSDRLDLAAGIFANWSLSEVMVLPALGLIWRPNDQWILQATPPIIALGYRPTSDWTLGLVAYPGGGAWEVGDSSDPIRQINLTLWRAALSIEKKFGPHWRLSLRSGLAFGGDLEFRDSTARVLSATDLDPAPFAAAALKWAF